MDIATYAILLFGALAGGFVSGLAGFGTALMALGIWLYILPPAIAVPLVLICSVSSQISTLPSMWKVLDFKLALPFVAGGLIGMPIGTLLVARADPQIFKLSVGVMLLVFPAALYFIRKAADGVSVRRSAGRRSGRICGRHPWWPRRPVRPASDLVGQRARLDEGSARGVFQIFNGAGCLGAALCLQIANGFVETHLVWLAMPALPGTLIGARLGMRAYQALSDRNFYDVVFAPPFLSGLVRRGAALLRDNGAWPPCAPSRLLYARLQSS